MCFIFAQNQADFFEKVLGLLPISFNYVTELETRSINFECQDLDLWLRELRKNTNFSIANSKTTNNGLIHYKSLICPVARKMSCEFSMKVTFSSGKCKVTCANLHNHSDDDSEFLKLKAPSETTKTFLIERFYEGLTPTQALTQLEKESTDFLSESKDRSLIPNLCDVYYLFEKERCTNFGESIITDDNLSDFIHQNENLLKIEHAKVDDLRVIAFCSKKMLAALSETKISAKVVCIDSSGGMDRSSARLFNLVIPGPVGGLSIGMFICFSETAPTIEKGLRLLKQIWTKNQAVDANFCPTVFMSDDSSAQIGAIQNVFKESTVLLCIFHVLNAFWKWLQSNVKSGKESNLRQNLWYKLRQLIYATENSDSISSELRALVSGDKKLEKHVDGILKKSRKILKTYRSHFELFGVDTNNIIERFFLKIKDEYLQRNKCFNALHLISQVILEYEDTVYRKLAKFINGRGMYAYDGLKCLGNDELVRISQTIIDYNFPDPSIDLEFEQPEPFDIGCQMLQDPDDQMLHSDHEASDHAELTNADNEILKKAFENIQNALEIGVYKPTIMKSLKKIANAKSPSALVNSLAIVGTTRLSILKTQSRIAKSSSKNRFKDLKMKILGSQPRKLSEAVRRNIRNKQTQSKK